MRLVRQAVNVPGLFGEALVEAGELVAQVDFFGFDERLGVGGFKETQG